MSSHELRVAGDATFPVEEGMAAHSSILGWEIHG